MTPDLAIQDSGLRTSGDRLQYLWLRIVSDGREAFRCVVLRELTYIPIEAREDPDVLGKQWAAVRGKFDAGAEFIHTAGRPALMLRRGMCPSGSAGRRIPWVRWLEGPWRAYPLRCPVAGNQVAGGRTITSASRAA